MPAPCRLSYSSIRITALITATTFSVFADVISTSASDISALRPCFCHSVDQPLRAGDHRPTAAHCGARFADGIGEDGDAHAVLPGLGGAQVETAELDVRKIKNGRDFLEHENGNVGAFLEGGEMAAR